MKVANPSSQDRTPRRAIVLAVPPAVAPYRASGLVHWHFSDMTAASSHVRFQGQTGKYLLAVSISPFIRPLP